MLSRETMSHRDMMNAHQMIGMLHDRMWEIKDGMSEFFTFGVSQIVGDYSYDDPKIVFQIQNLTNAIEYGSVHLCKTLGQTSKYGRGETFIILRESRGHPYPIDPGIDSWKLLLFQEFPKSLLERKISKVVTDKWLSDIDQIKRLLYAEMGI
jgi:hypothetical protein